MDFEELQDVLNRNALDDVERIRAEERLNNSFNRHEDAVAFIEAQEHPDRLFARQKDNGKFTVQPLVLLDADGLPIQDGDILFWNDDSYCTARIMPMDDRRLAFNLSWQRDGKEIYSSKYLYGNSCQSVNNSVRHHRWSDKEKKDCRIRDFHYSSALLSPFIIFLALSPLLIDSDVGKHPALVWTVLIIAALIAVGWLVSICCILRSCRQDSKMVKEAVKAAAVLYLDSNTVAGETEGVVA